MKVQTDRVLVDDRFKISDINDDGKEKYFKNVSRITFKNEDFKIELDINTTIYPVETNQEFLVLICTKFGEKAFYVPGEFAKNNPDTYEYVMCGNVFEMEKEEEGKAALFASFGGLLMKVGGSQESIAEFRQDTTESRVYIMLKRV